MKNKFLIKNVIATLVVTVFGIQLASAAQETWQGVSGTSATTNWSDTANWSGAVSPSGNDIVFNGTGSVATAGQINNVVDQDFSVTSLLYTNSNGQFHTTRIRTGTTLTDSGAFRVGYITNDNYQTSVAISGGGTLVVSGTQFHVGMAGSSSGTTGVATNDMSGLSNFVYNASSGTWIVAGSGGGTARGAGVLYLAGLSNNVTVGTINFNTGGGNNSGFHSQIQFGSGTNILNVGTFNICTTKAQFATVQFINSAPATAGVRIRGAAGNSDDTSRATITLGNRNNTGGGDTRGELLLSGHGVDIKAGTLTIGSDTTGSGSTVHSGTGMLQFDNGIIDVTNVVMAADTGAGSAGAATGTLIVGGSGQVIVGVGDISIANKSGGGTAASGTLIITNGGTIICSNNITKAATASTTGTIVMSNGTLRVDGIVASASAPIDTFSITNSTLTLGIPNSGASVTVSTLNSGGATNKINISSINGNILAYPTAFQVIKYSVGNGTNVGEFNFVAGTLPPGGYTGFISNDVANSAVDLVVTGGPAPPRTLIWKGLNGSTLTSTWDINTTPDWLSNSTAVTYNDNGGLGGDIVSFDDTGATNLVILAAPVSPTGINVTNNVRDYTISDNNNNNAIGGDGILNKQGSKALILDNSGGVALTGGVTIGAGTVQVGKNDTGGGLGSGPVANNGTVTFNRANNIVVNNLISGTGGILVSNQTASTSLQLGGANSYDGDVYVVSGVTLIPANSAALGSTNGATTLASGATLDVKGPGIAANGLNFNGERVTVSGTGVGGSGAIVNSGANTQQNVLQRVTLAGDTTFGGSARWDIRGTGASLNTGNNPYNLTKIGANQISLVGAAVDSALADIDIQQGTLSFETTSTGLGDPTKKVTVEAGATLQVFAITNQLNKHIALNGDGTATTLNNGSGTTTSTIIGPMALTNGVIFGGAGSNSVTVLSNTIVGDGSLTKNTISKLVIAGMDNHSGFTAVNDGTFILNGISTDPNNVLTINTTQSAATLPVIFGGSGTNAGPVDVEDTIWPGVNGHASTLTIGNGPGNDYPGYDGTLMFGASGNGVPIAIFNLGSSTTVGGGVNDLIVVNGDFDGNLAHVKINPVAILNTNSPYTLVTYNGAKGFNFNGTVLSVVSSRYGFTLDQSTLGLVKLNVTGGPVTVEWNNAAADNLWSSQNWKNLNTSANDIFYNLDTVLLDDTVGGTSAVITNTSAVSPSAVTNNSSTVNYTLSGSGKITGTAGLTKSGSSTLTINTTNDFTGDVMIQGGTVVVQNSSSLGATNGTVTITNGGTLSLAASSAANGLNFGSKPFVVSGAGVGGNGALFNSGTNQQNAYQNVTLAGDTVFGGSQRWDIRSPVNTNASATLSTTGHAYKITKVGTNFIALSSVNVDPALADIDVQSGTLSIETQTTSLGNTNNKVTVFNGAQLWLWNLTNIISKPITLQAGSLLNSGQGNNTYNGPLTVSGDSTLSIASLGLTLNSTVGLTGSLTVTNPSASPLTLNGVVSGAGGITKTGAGTLTLNANNTYTGNTTISAGTLAIGGSAAIASTNVNIASGATLTDANNSALSSCPNISDNGELNVAALTASTLTLNSGQTLGGSGHITGLLTAGAGSVLSPGGKSAVGTLTVSSAVVLSGTNYFEVASSSSYDKLVSGGVTYGGTLVVSNMTGSPFTTANSFQLFGAGTYNGGTFANIVPANPNNDPSLLWDTSSLSIDGTLKIVSSGPGVFTQKPRMTTVGFNGNNIVASVTNAQAGDGYYLLVTTNLNSPWKVIATNVPSSVGANGSFTFIGTNVVSGTAQQQFYILVSTNSVNGIP